MAIKSAVSRFKEARFCPWCGTESLIRDDYRREHGNKIAKDGRTTFHCAAPEFTCTCCQWGFQIKPSLRHEQANSLFAQHRKLRPPQDA